jgi:N-acetyl-anhydromuramyl-L-alanine amidase AmpD
VNFIQWLNRLLRVSPDGRLPTLPKSSSPSSASSTSAPSIRPKQSAKSYPEQKIRTPNVSAKPIKPEAIVLHHSGGSYAGGVSWIRNPKSRVSYHVLVAQDGRRTVFASPTQRTWHAGKSEWRGKRDLNSWSIGVAFEGDTNKRELGEAEMASLAEYLAPIMREYRLTVADVTDHRTVSPGRKDDLSPKAFAVVKKYLATAL